LVSPALYILATATEGIVIGYVSVAVLFGGTSAVDVVMEGDAPGAGEAATPTFPTPRESFTIFQRIEYDMKNPAHAEKY